MVGKVPQSVILNKFQDAGIPARQIVQILRPLYVDKGKAPSKYSKDTETKDKREVSFKGGQTSLAEVGRK